jgi:hypothetical protein
VVFKCASDVGAAYKYETQNSLFGQANVKFRLKQVCQPKEERSVQSLRYSFSPAEDIYSVRFDRDLQHGHMRYDSDAYDVSAMG